MTDEIKQYIDAQIAAVQKAGVYGVGAVPFHIHNGTDSPTLPFKGLNDVPRSYTGQSGKVLTVNTTETGLTYTNNGGAASITVKDGTTTVNNVTTVKFTGGATVTNPGGNEADVAIASAGTPAGVNEDVQFNDNGVFGGDVNIQWEKAAPNLRLSGQCGILPNDKAGAADSIYLEGGNSLSGGGAGGDVNITGGTPDTGGRGGSIILQPWSGTPNGTVQITGVTGSPSYRAVGTVNTTNATPQNVAVLTVPSNSSGYVEARVVGYRTGGASGSANDSTVAQAIRGFKNNAGTLTLLGSTAYPFYYEDAVTNVDFAVSGTTLELQLTGRASTNITWNYEVMFIGSTTF